MRYADQVIAAVSIVFTCTWKCKKKHTACW